MIRPHFKETNKLSNLITSSVKNIPKSNIHLSCNLLCLGIQVFYNPSFNRTKVENEEPLFQSMERVGNFRSY